jgi:hypothetical protein
MYIPEKGDEKQMKQYFAMKIIAVPTVALAYFGRNYEYELSVPNGCIGIGYFFKDKKSGREYFGNKIKFIQINSEGAQNGKK